MIRNLMMASVCAFAFTGSAAADSINIQGPKLSLSDVPPGILAIARAAAGSVQLTEAAVEIEDGKAVFEFKGKGANGMEKEIDVLMDGTLDEIEDQIPTAEVPKAVQDVLSKWLPGFKASKAERSTRGNGAVVYEFDGQLAGVEVDVEISSDGSKILVVDDSRG